MKKFWILALFLLAAPILTAAEWTPILTNEEEVNGRSADRYRHDSDPAWGAKNPDQTDEFSVIHPTNESGVNAENRPLYVVLHSAGGSLNANLDFMRTSNHHNIYNVPDDFYGLDLDCKTNDATDWWWGGLRAEEEITEENRDKSGSELSPAEKRVIATVRWVMAHYKIDPNRVYLCGNSMGGSGTLGIGLRHGDIFAAIKANVPAGCRHAADRMFFPPQEIPAGVHFPDPPVCVDYSANNDEWSRDHIVLFRAMRERKYSLLAFWGPFGHQSNHDLIEPVNDLFNRFDWLSIRKNEAYPVFTDASTDNPIPWTDNFQELPGSAPAGQVNAYFRWENLADTQETIEMSLRLAAQEEIRSQIFDVPTASTADVTLRRLQEFAAAPGEKIAWTFGELGGTVEADSDGLVTIPRLTVTDQPTVLKLTKISQ